MSNINNSSNNNNNTNSTQSETIYPHIIFLFERKDYTIVELLTVFSAHFLDFIYLHNVIPPESPCAAIRVSVPTLNLLTIVIPTSTDYQIYYCDTCPHFGAEMIVTIASSNQQSNTNSSAPPSQNHLVAHTAKRLNNQPQKVII